MPIKSQFGYLFVTPNSRTIAHEIAHGYFNLKHTFSEKYNFEQSGTDNLMDYANETKSYKYQWDLVHDKGLMIAKLWQSDSAGENMSFIEKVRRNAKENKTFKEKFQTSDDVEVLINKDSKVNLHIDFSHLFKKDSVEIDPRELYEYEGSSRINTPLYGLVYKQKKTNDILIGIYLKYYEKDKEDKRKELKAWLLNKQTTDIKIINNQAKDIKINNGINAVSLYIGTPYKQDTTRKSRTGDSLDALAKMDCSEFVCRYLQKLGITKKVEWLNTDGLKNYADTSTKLFTAHTDTSYIPQRGDIFIWNRGGENTSGHTGIVLSYNSQKRRLKILDASTDKGKVDSREMNLDHIIKTHKGLFYTPNP